MASPSNVASDQDRQLKVRYNSRIVGVHKAGIKSINSTTPGSHHGAFGLTQTGFQTECKTNGRKRDESIHNLKQFSKLQMRQLSPIGFSQAVEKAERS